MTVYFGTEVEDALLDYLEERDRIIRSRDMRTPFFSPCSAGEWLCAAWKIWLKSMPAP